MADVLGYARVSTGDQDVAGQALRLREAGAIKVFTDIRSGRSMERPGLATLLDYARHGDPLCQGSCPAPRDDLSFSEGGTEG
jgi:DNA invertase Pin-like site-specific DNA recombinase